MISPLIKEICQADRDNIPLQPDDIDAFVEQLHPDWILTANNNHLSRQFHFDSHEQCVLFAGAVNYLCHKEYHQADLAITDSICLVHFADQISEQLSINDFILASKIDLLFEI